MYDWPWWADVDMGVCGEHRTRGLPLNHAFQPKRDIIFYARGLYVLTEQKSKRAKSAGWRWPWSRNILLTSSQVHSPERMLWIFSSQKGSLPADPFLLFRFIESNVTTYVSRQREAIRQHMGTVSGEQGARRVGSEAEGTTPDLILTN